jgi:hypothetical protein
MILVRINTSIFLNKVNVRPDEGWIIRGLQNNRFCLSGSIPSNSNDQRKQEADHYKQQPILDQGLQLRGLVNLIGTGNIDKGLENSDIVAAGECA